MHLHIYLLVRMKSNPDGEVNSGLRRVTNSNGILAILTSSVCNWLFSTGRVTYMLFWSFLTLWMKLAQHSLDSKSRAHSWHRLISEVNIFISRSPLETLKKQLGHCSTFTYDTNLYGQESSNSVDVTGERVVFYRNRLAILQKHVARCESKI